MKVPSGKGNGEFAARRPSPFNASENTKFHGVEPAMVVMMLVVKSTVRIQSLVESAIYRTPDAYDKLMGHPKYAFTASPLSPPFHEGEPPPTAVEIVRLLASTARTRPFIKSAIYTTFELASTAKPCGDDSCASVAAPPSPEKPLVPTPAYD